MNKFLHTALFILVTLILSGCFYTFKRNVSLDDTKREISKINYSDGISDIEAKIISQNYLLTTNEEPCKSLAKIYDVGTPYRKIVDDYYYMGFLKYGWFVVKPNAPWLRLLVDTKTGQVTCIGEIQLKNEQKHTIR